MRNARNSGKPSKKLTSGLPDEYTTIAVDQTRKAVGCELYRAWFPQGERTPLPYWKTYEGINLLGAITDDGESFFTEVADSFTSDVTVQFLRAIQDEFGDHLHIVLDNATYFASNQVAEFVEDTPPQLTFLPTGSPVMNPVEECWRQFKRALGNRYFDEIAELRSAVWEAIEKINPPKLTDYLRPSV